VSDIGSGLDRTGKTAGSRRLIAVVYADMVGYSRLISLDDAGTLRRLRTLRRALIDPAIREYGGRVVQTGGDSLLIAFDSIDGAVRCAVRVQQQVPVYDGDQPPDRRIRFRIGINIGDVIPDGTNLHGDGVNIAARLEAACPVGGICVSRSVRDHVHGRLDRVFEPIGELTLKNISRPVEAFVLRLDPGAIAQPPASVTPRPWSRWLNLSLAGGVLLIAASGAAWWWLHARTIQIATTFPAVTDHADASLSASLSKAPRLSIVVLPFANLSGDPKDNYLAEGITEDVTTDLSRVPGMFVIARESAYTYQGKSTDVRKIGEQLGVRYVLEGSVRRLTDGLRVNSQLVDTETGAHLWADRFDRKSADLSAGQEEIVDRIGKTLNVALSDLESARSKRERPTNPDAFDLILRARSLGLHPMGPEEHAARTTLYQQALQLDPKSILAMTGLAYELEYLQAYSGQGDPERAAKLLNEAAAIDPNDPYVLGASAFSLYSRARFAEAISTYQRLLSEYPNAYDAHYMIGNCLIWAGRPEEAIPRIETAMQLDPRSPWNYDKYSAMSIALLMLERYQDSIGWTERALATIRTTQVVPRAFYFLRLTAAYALLGRLEEAHRALAEANRLWPYDTVRSHAPPDPSNRMVAERFERYQAALRIAGHRDHAEEDADFGVTADDTLREDYPGLTPTTVPGAVTIHTAEFADLLDVRRPVVIDALLHSWGRSIPGAVGLKNAGHGGGLADATQSRLRKKMRELTKDDLATPIVAVGWNSERFDGYNLALRLVALGYTNVHWYRGGREAWEVAGLPETQVDVQDW
jgi:adenylate cyclase